MNYYAFHIGDYAVHTRHLTLMEDLAYRRLLDWYYVHEKPIPAETQSVARLVGMREHAAEIDAVLREFFTQNEAGQWTQPRCEAEIIKAQAAAERARVNGRHGGRKPKNAPPTDPAEPTETQSVPAGGPAARKSQAPNPNPKTNKKIPPNPLKGEVGGPGFQRFWNEYPACTKKAARLQCWEKWKARGLDAVTDRVIAHVKAMKATEQWQRESGRYIPAPLVYLNQDRWEAPTSTEDPSADVAQRAIDETQRLLREQEEHGRRVEAERLARKAAKAAKEASQPA